MSFYGAHNLFPSLGKPLGFGRTKAPRKVFFVCVCVCVCVCGQQLGENSHLREPHQEDLLNSELVLYVPL